MDSIRKTIDIELLEDLENIKLHFQASLILQIFFQFDTFQ